MSDIRWTSDPLPRSEEVDLLALNDDDARHYARDLQIEMASLRDLLHEAVAALHRANRREARFHARIDELVDTVQTLHRTISSLSARIRTLEDQ